MYGMRWRSYANIFFLLSFLALLHKMCASIVCGGGAIEQKKCALKYFDEQHLQQVKSSKMFAVYVAGPPVCIHRSEPWPNREREQEAEKKHKRNVVKIRGKGRTLVRTLVKLLPQFCIVSGKGSCQIRRVTKASQGSRVMRMRFREIPGPCVKEPRLSEIKDS